MEQSEDSLEMKITATDILLEFSFNNELVRELFLKPNASIPAHLENLF